MMVIWFGYYGLSFDKGRQWLVPLDPTRWDESCFTQCACGRR